MSRSTMFNWLVRMFSNQVSNQALALARQVATQQEGLMATVQELEAKIDAANVAAAEERVEVQRKIAVLTAQSEEQTAQIVALREQLAQGGTVTPEDLDRLALKVEAMRVGIGQISEPVPTEPTT